MVVEEALAAVEGAVGVVPGGDLGEESQRTKMYAPTIYNYVPSLWQKIVLTYAYV